MKNYISINGKEIELTEEQVRQIEKAVGIGCVKLADVPIGTSARIGGTEFIVLEHIEGGGTAVITRNLIEDNTEFGKANNFDGAYVDDICREFGEAMEKAVGAENILTHDVDLTADDGLKDYGKVERKVSLLTVDLYRRYVYILDKFKPGKWWWLATPFSTKTHGGEYSVKCVAPSGCVYNNNYLGNFYYGGHGVRPFCIFDSSIFVSVEKEK